MIAGFDVENVLPEHIVPYLSLSVPIDQVAFLERKKVIETREVLTIVDLI